MEGIVGAIQKFSTEDGPGIRTTVFLKGCPLDCKWCHNPELIQFGSNVYHNPKHCIGCGTCINVCKNKALDVSTKGIELIRENCNTCLECTKVCYSGALTVAGKKMSVREVMDIVLQDKGFYERTEGGLTISGGELLSQPEFAKELMETALENGVRVILDTCGYGNGEKLYEMAKKAQYILYDFKHFNRDSHIYCTGKPNDIILNNLRLLAKDADVREKIIMRMPLIHDLNDQYETMENTARLYQELGIKHVNLIAYHELGKVKASCVGRSFNSYKAPDGDYLRKLKELYETFGANVEIIGEGV